MQQLKLNAKARLLAEDSAGHVQREQLDHQIENKEGQVKNLKKSMPSRENRMQVSPDQRHRTERQIHQTEMGIDDLRLRKSKIGD